MTEKKRNWIADVVSAKIEEKERNAASGGRFVMTKNEIVRKNIELHAEWMRYVFEHPKVLDKIPKGAELIIVPN